MKGTTVTIKMKLLSVAAVVALGTSTLYVVPFASAAEPDSGAIALCDKARIINGVPQQFVGVGNGPMADSCTYRETGFETFDGPTEKVSETFPNCPPDTFNNGSVAVAFEQGIAQYTGDYKLIQAGVQGSLLSALNGSWKKHEATLDLEIKTALARDNTSWPLPVGKVLHVTHTPRMHKMTGIWHVYTETTGGFPGGDPIVIHDIDIPQVVIGPVVLPGGLVDGTITPVYEDC